MSTPTCTYRLQFRNGMTFERATGLIPHWLKLGISHVYASPIFAATAGSTHGYDVIDPNVVEPELGGRDGFDRFAAALRDAGLGLILDIVPNHLAASLENSWWKSIVEHGANSPYSGYFDTDWSQKLTLPVISGTIEEEIASGNIRVVTDADGLSVDYFGSCYPLDPQTYESVRSHIGGAVPADGTVLRDRHVLDLQPWQFIPWRQASQGLSYRRFFEITGLVGMRVEQPEVFDAMHRTVLEMVRSGQIDGLRIDHIDGLADPEAYLNRLRDAIGPDIYLVVEKILEGDEQLPPQWPVNGTTGYEFISALADVFAGDDPAALDTAYHAVAPEFADGEAEFRKAKALMVDRNFQGEVSALERLACEIADAEQRQISRPEIAAALRELLIAFPVYRTYGSPRGLYPQDRHVLHEVFAGLAETTNPEYRAALKFLEGVLRGDAEPEAGEAARRFRTRMQHLTGPLLAKALEDTFFYRYNRLLAVNEVGGDPLSRNGSVARFHARMQQRVRNAPTALTATSTHDTKRGEDARARLLTLSEAPDVWAAAVQRWRAINEKHRTPMADGSAPEGNIEWSLYQALAGVWPPGLDTTDETALKALADRFLPYVEKALREAKLRTDWADGDKAYEDAVARYADALLSRDNVDFLDDFERTLKPFVQAGLLNSLSQTLLKLTAPGIPDIYQGCEGYDFSLVDPDNRRLPDFKRLASDRPDALLPDGIDISKWLLITRALEARRKDPDLFTIGEYMPLRAHGPARDNIVAFARQHGDRAAIVIAPRKAYELVSDSRSIRADFWQGTSLELPASLQGLDMVNVLDCRRQRAEKEIDLSRMFAHAPLALLVKR